MAGFKPKVPFSVTMKLLIPTSINDHGVTKKTFPKPEGAPVFFGSFRTFGGSEQTQNDVYTLVNTATVDTWFRPDIKADCRIYICDTAQVYEVISDPEDIELRHQYLQFKVRKVGGKA